MLAKLLIVPIVLAIGFIGWQVLSSQNTAPEKTYNSTPIPTTASSRTFTASSVMGGFSIQIPEGFTAEEKLLNLILKNKDGQIIIGKYASNYLNLEDHLRDLHSKNKVKIIEDKRTMIGGWETAVQTIELNNQQQQKIYVLFVDGYIYDLFTDSSNLYLTLDQIAQSFTLPK